nr:hypothetical protein [Tanacetum cinerariifolium]
MRNTTVEEYITITRINFESGNEKGRIELKGRFLIELCDNAFSRTNGKDAVEHIKIFLEIVDSLNIPNVKYKDDWIYRWNDGIPWVNEKPWTKDGEWTDLISNIGHKCIPLHLKNRTALRPTCNWKEDGYCNTGDLPGFIRDGNSIRYEDYEWYDTIEDSKLKEEALINKRILEESMNMMEESSEDE